jgi:hypothetical protein
MNLKLLVVQSCNCYILHVVKLLVIDPFEAISKVVSPGASPHAVCLYFTGLYCYVLTISTITYTTVSLLLVLLLLLARICINLGLHCVARDVEHT